jgi:hypothetical protein
MTGGFAVTKEPGTDLFAPAVPPGRVRRARLRLPPSRRERRPARQVARVREQLAGWHGVIVFDDMGQILPGGRVIPPRRPADPGNARATAHPLMTWLAGAKPRPPQADGRARR